MDIRERNGIRIAEILEKVGPEDAVIKVDGSEWNLEVYYTDRNDVMLTIEMCLVSRVHGESLVDPLMDIELSLDSEGHITKATPVHYMSRTLFSEEELYLKGNPDCWNPKLCVKGDELDRKLAVWLENLKIQGYISNGQVQK